ncbi:MAG: DciA family protein [Rhizobiaceae bacterium]
MSQGSKKQWSNRRGAQPVSDLVSKLLDPVIERRAGMTMDLIASWEEIVGETHAARSRPEKLQWTGGSGDVGGSGDGGGRNGGGESSFEPATLIVACDGGYALYLQHDSDTVLSQVNDYFGFSAVSRMKLVQKPLSPAGRPRNADRRRADRTSSPSADRQSRLEDLVKDVEDEDLKKALEKLGRGVFSEGSSSKD